MLNSGKVNIKKYSYFVLVDASVRGPFISPYVPVGFFDTLGLDNESLGSFQTSLGKPQNCVDWLSGIQCLFRRIACCTVSISEEGFAAEKHSLAPNAHAEAVPYSQVGWAGDQL